MSLLATLTPTTADKDDLSRVIFFSKPECTARRCCSLLGDCPAPSISGLYNTFQVVYIVRVLNQLSRFLEIVVFFFRSSSSFRMFYYVHDPFAPTSSFYIKWLCSLVVFTVFEYTFPRLPFFFLVVGPSVVFSFVPIWISLK